MTGKRWTAPGGWQIDLIELDRKPSLRVRRDGYHQATIPIETGGVAHWHAVAGIGVPLDQLTEA